MTMPREKMKHPDLKTLFNNTQNQWFTFHRAEVQAIVEALDKKDKVIRMQKQLIRELKK